MTKIEALSIAVQVMEQYANNDEEVEEALDKILEMKDRMIYNARHARMGYGPRPESLTHQRRKGIKC